MLSDCQEIVMLGDLHDIVQLSSHHWAGSKLEDNAFFCGQNYYRPIFLFWGIIWASVMSYRTEKIPAQNYLDR